MSRRRVVGAVAAAALAAATGTVVSLTVGSPAGAVPQCPAEPDFESSIVEPIQGPAAAPTDEDAITYATVGGDGKLYTYDTDISSGEGLAVSALACLGGGAKDTPAVVDYPGGRAFFVLAPNNRVYQRFISDDGTLNTVWSVVPGAPAAGGSPAAVLGPNGVHLFVRGANGQVYTSYTDPAAPGVWVPFASLGGSMVGTPGIGVSGTRVAVVVRAPNNAVYAKISTAAGTFPAAWSKLAAATSASPTVAAGFGPDRLDIFVTGTTGGLYQSYVPITASSVTVTAFKKIDADVPPGTRLAAAGQAGRMGVYATVPLGGGATAVGLKQYVPGYSWFEFLLAPYTCVDCLPTVEEGAAAGTRVVKTKTPLK